MNNDNLYEVLGVNENATQDDIKRAYKKLAKEKELKEKIKAKLELE